MFAITKLSNERVHLPFVLLSSFSSIKLGLNAGTDHVIHFDLICSKFFDTLRQFLGSHLILKFDENKSKLIFGKIYIVFQTNKNYLLNVGAIACSMINMNIIKSICFLPNVRFLLISEFFHHSRVLKARVSGAFY